MAWPADSPDMAWFFFNGQVPISMLPGPQPAYLLGLVGATSTSV